MATTTTTTSTCARTACTNPCACTRRPNRSRRATPLRDLAAALERPLTSRELALADAAYTRGA